MKLYRSVSLEELHALLMNKKVDPIFDRENADSTYTSKLGKVTCWFTKPYALSPIHYDFVVVAEIDEKNIIGYGLGEYSREDIYNAGHFLYSKVEEVYTRGYTIKEVDGIFLNDNNWEIILCDFLRKDFLFFLEEIENREHPDDVLDTLKENIDIMYDVNYIMFANPKKNSTFWLIRDLVKNHYNSLKNIKNYDDVFWSVVGRG
jgi:hypothetical protein